MSVKTDGIEEQLVNDWTVEDSENILHDDYFRDQYRNFEESGGLQGLDVVGDIGGYSEGGEYYQNLLNMGYTHEVAENARIMSIYQMNMQSGPTVKEAGSGGWGLPPGYNQYEDFPLDSIGADGQIVKHALRPQIGENDPSNDDINAEFKGQHNTISRMLTGDDGNVHITGYTPGSEYIEPRTEVYLDSTRRRDDYHRPYDYRVRGWSENDNVDNATIPAHKFLPGYDPSKFKDLRQGDEFVTHGLFETFDLREVKKDRNSGKINSRTQRIMDLINNE